MGDTLARQEKKQEQTDTISGHPFHPCGHGKYHNLDYEGKKMPQLERTWYKELK
jgi:hypothetical protein